MKKAFPIILLAGASWWLWSRRGQTPSTQPTGKPDKKTIKKAQAQAQAASATGRGRGDLGMVLSTPTVW